MDTPCKAVAVSLFWSNRDEFVSRMICRVTNGQHSHMGLVFRMEDGQAVYFESLFSEGVSGPKPMDKLMDWGMQEGHTLLIETLWWLRLDQVEAIHARAIAMVGKAGYGKVQILSHWWMERMGKRYGWRMRNTPDKVTCSEYAARACRHDWVLTDTTRDHFDAVTPESARIMHYATMRVLKLRPISLQLNQSKKERAREA